VVLSIEVDRGEEKIVATKVGMVFYGIIHIFQPQA
jgi:hypothetical protein